MPTVAVGDLIRGKYELMNSVGSGAYSNVYKCKDTHSMEEKAIKVIDDHSSWEVEVSFLRKLGEGKSEDTRFLMCHLEDFKWRKNYFIVMPLHKMSLFDFWDTDEAVFFIDHIKDIAYQLLSAVAYIHSLEIVHCDIKMENILLENVDEINDVINGEPKKALKNTKIVLCDFDKARILKKGESVNDGKLVQTQCVRAPEVILERRRFVDRSRPLTSWVRSLVLGLIMNFLDVILSLGLLSNYEFPSFFWFYGEVVLQEMMNNSGAEDDLIAKQTMCRGIYFACLAMIKRDQINFPHENSEQVCYEHRLEQLLELPFVPNFQEYLSLSRKPEHLKKYNAEELWKKSTFYFKRCRELIHCRDMFTACNRNLTAARLLAVVEDRQVSWEFSEEFGIFPALVISK